ncbi:MAG TPA: DUF4440 domain-containing protein [Pyrinomonadaceae bacterium]|nr:DUF4440 domain-containing protein [Pyrinomonadaceae bacterium]
MKSLSYAAIPIAFAVLMSFAGCASPPTSSDANVGPATPEPTPDQAAITTELTRIENDWPRIIKERDSATLRRTEAEDLVIIYPDGTLGNKEQDVKDTEAGNFSFDSWDTSDVKVNVVNKDTAVVQLRYTVKNGKIKSPDGKSLDVSGQYLSLDTFARRNGQWQFVGLSTVKVQAPVTAASPTPGVSPAAPVPGAVKPSPTTRPSPVTRATPAAKPSAPRPTPAAKPSAPRPTPARVPATPVGTP